MRHRPRTAPGRAGAAALPAAAAGLAVWVASAVGACGGGRSEAPPVAMLASSPQSAAAFETIREGWDDLDETSPAALRINAERFIAEFPGDGLVPLARIALAFAAMGEGDLAAADAALARTAGLPPGSAQELWTMARARRLRLGGDAEAALVLLRPLVGKSVDPLGRGIFVEELALTALATHRDYEAISYMDAWLRASPTDERDATIAKVSALVARLPRDVLVGALQAMSTQRASLGYSADIERILAQRLVHIATSSGDAQLARTLLEADPQAFTIAGDAGAALGELITSRRGLNVVQGRTLGLLLPTASPGLRDESADVLRGVLWALGLPRGARAAPLPFDAGAGEAGAGEAARSGPACAALEPGPDLPEPSSDDGVRLVTRDDAGRSDRTEVSLDELAGEGAAIVVAGLEAETAGRALKWGEAHGVPVIALVPPRDPGLPSFGFSLGEPRSSALAALARLDPSLAGETVAQVVDASEVLSTAPAGDAGPALRLGLPVSCDIPAARAGEARFPLAEWDAEKTHAWIVSGSPDCGRDLVGELAASRAHGVVALTLEAAARIHAPAGLRVLTAQAGVVPEAAPGDPREEELARFAATLGQAGWWTALGRDAATLGRAALLRLPTDAVSESGAVADRRAAARAVLAAARARLWTAESSGWTDSRTVKRTVCAEEQPAR